MHRTIPLPVGTALAVIHFLIVGIPFIVSKGGGEAIGYLVFFVDFPLEILGEMLFPRPLLNSVAFNFFWFVGLGTIMYFLIGYGASAIISRAAPKPGADT